MGNLPKNPVVYYEFVVEKMGEISHSYLEVVCWGRILKCTCFSPIIKVSVGILEAKNVSFVILVVTSQHPGWGRRSNVDYVDWCIRSPIYIYI